MEALFCRLGFDAHAMRHLGHTIRTHFHHQLRGNGVQRIGERGGECHFASIFLLVIFRGPVADTNRRVITDGIGVSPDSSAAT